MLHGTDLTILNNIEEGIVAADDHSTIVFFNTSAERMFGYSAEEVLGQSLELLIPESSRTSHPGFVTAFRHSEAISRMKGERSDIRGRRADGTVFDAEISISKSSIDADGVVVAIIRDVTHRRAAEALLVASEQKHRAVLETCSDAILIADAETGCIVEVNGRATDLFGCAESDLIGLHQTKLHPLEDRERYRQIFREHMEAGPVLVPDAEICRFDGTIVPIEISARPVRIGDRLKMVGFFRDVTHRKAHEQQLIEAKEAAMEASRSKTTFLANVSHELRTPLNAVIAFAEIIGSEFFGPVHNVKYREYARDIVSSGRHLLDLINDILDLSQVELGHIQLRDEDVDLVDLLEAARQTMRPLILEKELNWKSLVSPAARHLSADRRSVLQMILNLLSNAVRFTPRGGSVSTRVFQTPDGSTCLLVEDSGSGIARERLLSITMPFNSKNERAAEPGAGTGLGLAITKGLVERHGGSIEISSELGIGTCVRLLFPAHRSSLTDQGDGNSRVFCRTDLV